MVLFAVPNKVDDVKHCIALSESISTGIRKLFSVIEYDALIKEVNLQSLFLFSHHSTNGYFL